MFRVIILNELVELSVKLRQEVDMHEMLVPN